MVDKNSRHYVKSEFERNCYGNGKRTVYERSLNVEGKNKEDVEYTSAYVQSAVM